MRSKTISRFKEKLSFLSSFFLCGLLTVQSYGAVAQANDGATQNMMPAFRDYLSTQSNYISSKSSAIALSPDGKYLWAVNRDSNSVSVVDTATRRLIYTIPVGREPRVLAITPNGQRVFVANALDNGVSVIDVKVTKNGRFEAHLNSQIGKNGFLITGSEPRSLVISPDGSRVYVANRAQDTLTILNARTLDVVGGFNLRNSACNKGDKSRHFMPGDINMSDDGSFLFVTRLLAFTSDEGVQANDSGKEGLICRIRLNKMKRDILETAQFQSIVLPASNSGFNDPLGFPTKAFPNQLQQIILRDGKAYLPNIGASPSGPVNFKTTTQAFVSVVDSIYKGDTSAVAFNLHLGGRDPEAGKAELYFANPSAIAFTSKRGKGFAYVTSAGSDILVKLVATSAGDLQFTVDEDTTRYIDLNDPDNLITSGAGAGKNPVGLVIDNNANFAYTLNYISRNISVIDLREDRVVDSIKLSDLPLPGSEEERLLVGAEMFFSSRGNFVRPSGALGSSRDRLSEKGRQNCASCHLDGLSDGVVWQFASGPRKTLSINGTFNPLNRAENKIINASAIFDEVEDADFNTRNVSSGGPLSAAINCAITPPFNDISQGKLDPNHGLVLGSWDTFDLAPCVMNQFLLPNANRPQPFVQLPGSSVKVKALDALVDWQRLSVRTPNRPMTRSELFIAGLYDMGGLKDDEIVAGEKLYRSAGCQNCHKGGMWTKSARTSSSAPLASDISTESGVVGVNQQQYLFKYLTDIGSFNLNVINQNNSIGGYRNIGGVEKDSNGFGALGFDYNGDGKGSGFNVPSILGMYHVQPYYHNGACETLLCVLNDEKHRRAGLVNGNDLLASAVNRSILVQYLESVDVNTPVH